MTLTTTNTTTAPIVDQEPKRHLTVDDIVGIPLLGDTIPVLFERRELFVDAEQAEAWMQTHGGIVLQGQKYEFAFNNICATAPERRDHGVKQLERAILAQAAWLRMFGFYAPMHRLGQLKQLVQAIRDAESDDAYMAAKSAIIKAYAEMVQGIKDRDEAVSKVLKYAEEEHFILRMRSDLLDTRRGTSDPEWAIHALDRVLMGHSEKCHPNDIKALARQLDFHARKFFGPTEGGASKPKVKKPGSAARRKGAPSGGPRRKMSAKEARKASKP